MALLHFVLEAVPVFDGLDPVATEEGLRAALRSGLVQGSRTEVPAEMKLRPLTSGVFGLRLCAQPHNPAQASSNVSSGRTQ